MGFRMERFGAEELEVELFLFAVLQIHLFSPWSAGRGCSSGAQGMGRLRGPGCSTATCMVPRLSLAGRPRARGREALAERGTAWPPPVPERRVVPSLTVCVHPFVECGTLKRLLGGWGAGERGAGSRQCQSPVPRPGC